MIGALATLSAISYIAALGSMPILLRRLGDRGALRASLITSAVALTGIVLTPWPWLWALLSVLLGFATGVRFTVAESWVPGFVTPGSRGQAVALFQTVVGAAGFAGSGVLLIASTGGPLLQAIVVTTAIAALVVLWSRRPPWRGDLAEASSPISDTADTRAPGVWAATILVGPSVLVAAALGGMIESGMWVALPLYGLASGAGPELATAAIAAMGLGSFAQYPFGALADRFPWRQVALGAAALIAASALLLPLVSSWPLILLGLGLVWGSAGGGLYTLATIHNSTMLRSRQLIGASAVTQLAYMLGDVAGPTLGGLAIDIAPRYGLVALVAVVGLVGLCVLLSVSRPHTSLSATTAGKPV
jgi:MFS family permease